MMKLYFKGSGFYVPTATVDADVYSDLMAVIDDLYEQDALPVPLYTREEMEELDGSDEEWLPINGGEYWIEGLTHVEELS